jgi:acyl-CoA thioester hydrolase
MQDFNTQINIQLDWSEMDLFGHINNVAYFKYIQAARVNFCESAGINTHRADNPLSFAVASSSCNFKKPLFYPGSIVVKTKVEWIKNSSFQLKHIIINEAGELSAEGVDVLVLFDYSVNIKILIPEAVREKLGSL